MRILSSHDSVMNTQFFWAVTPRHELISRHFERTQCLLLQHYVPSKRRESIAHRRAITSQKNGVTKVLLTELVKRFLVFKNVMFITVFTKALEWATFRTTLLYFKVFPYFTFYQFLYWLPLYS